MSAFLTDGPLRKSDENQQHLQAAKPLSSPLEPPRNITKYRVNTSDASGTNNKSLNDFTIEPLPLLGTDDVETFFNDQRKEEASTTLNAYFASETLAPPTILVKSTQTTTSPKASFRVIQDAVSNPAECKNKSPPFKIKKTNNLAALHDNVVAAPQAASNRKVRPTYKNFLIECLQNGEEMTFHEIKIAIKNKYPYIHHKSNKWDEYIKDELKMNETFEQITKSDGNVYWRINKRAIEDLQGITLLGTKNFKNRKAVIPSTDNPAYAPIPSHDSSTKSRIIQCLKNGEELTLYEITEKITKENRQLGKQPVEWKPIISSTLTSTSVFERVPDADGIKHKVGRWRLSKTQPCTPFISSTDNPSPVSTLYEHITYAQMITECLKNNRVLTCKELYKEIGQHYPGLCKMPGFWQVKVRDALTQNSSFELKNDQGGWGLANS